jgi:hypothetical protein
LSTFQFGPTWAKLLSIRVFGVEIKMTTEQVEAEALKLNPEARADLAEKLLRSLEDLSENDIQRLWAEEAVRRDSELDSGTASMRDAEDVFRDARTRIP